VFQGQERRLTFAVLCTQHRWCRARYVAEADTSAQSGNRLRSQELWNRVSRPGHNASYLASAFPLRWGYFFDERYPYVRIRPPRGARAFENADIFPPTESGTGQTNIFVQLSGALIAMAPIP
jgi:hypothetical protein